MEDRISTTAGEVTIMESTLRRLLKIVEEVRGKVELTDAPMPFGDMSLDAKAVEEIKRGKLTIKSLFSSVSFKILLDTGESINKPGPGGESTDIYDYCLFGILPENKKYECSKCKDTGVIVENTSKSGHAHSYVRCDHEFKRPGVEETKEIMEKDMSKIEVPQVSAGENLNSIPLEVKHADLESSTEHSIFKKECPVCNIGMLLVARDDTTLELLKEDRCIFCAQKFIYTDIEELKDKAGENEEIEKEKNTSVKSKWGSSQKYDLLTVKEIVDMGLLQEINRQFLHPLGFALGAPGEKDRLDPLATFGIWRMEEKNKEITFGNWPICSELIDKDKMHSMKDLQRTRFNQRKKEFGYIVQPFCETCQDRGSVPHDVDTLGGTVTRYTNCPKGCKRL